LNAYFPTASISEKLAKLRLSGFGSRSSHLVLPPLWPWNLELVPWKYAGASHADVPVHGTQVCASTLPRFTSSFFLPDLSLVRLRSGYKEEDLTSQNPPPLPDLAESFLPAPFFFRSYLL